MTRPIVFCTDYGLDDEFVGVCHGVIARIAPDARVIDLAHGIPPQDVLRGAMVLAGAAPFMPEDAVYLGVVDPDVGGPRGAVAVRAASGALLPPRPTAATCSPPRPPTWPPAARSAIWGPRWRWESCSGSRSQRQGWSSAR